MTRSFAQPVAHACRVCGRPAQIDDLCGRHGGSVGLIVQTEDLPRPLRIGLRFLVSGAGLTISLGILTSLIGGTLTGREDSPGASKLVGVLLIVVGMVAMYAAMYLSQLRPWALPAVLALCAATCVVSAVLLVITSPASSYVTLTFATTILPFLVAGVLIGLWGMKERRAAVGAPGPGSAGATA